MSFAQLRDAFPQLADAPEAALKLRQWVIDMGIAGGLTGARPSADAIKIENCLEPLVDGKRIHQGWSPRCETFPSRSDGRWGVLKTTAVQDGSFLENHNKELPTRLTPKEHLEVAPGDILLTCAGPRARCGIACHVQRIRPRLILSGKMYRFRPDKKRVLAEYLTLFLRSTGAQKAIDSMKTGSSESGLNLTKDRFRRLEVRFGTLDEQREILMRVGELLRFLERLEMSLAGREAIRQRFTRAAWARLASPDQNRESFLHHAAFSIDSLSDLTSKPDQVACLRKAILDLAVRGKLVKQHHEDEPAESLIANILADQKKTGQRVDKDVMKNSPFDIPKSWEWVQLGSIITHGPQNGISPRKSENIDSPKAITLTATTSGKFDSRHYKHVDLSVEDAARFWLYPGDLLFQRGNTREYVGIAAIYDGKPEGFVFPDLMMRVRVSDLLNLRYVHLWCVASFARDFLTSSASGAQKTMPKINQRVLRSLPVAIPPVEEQERIVVQVDYLMSICDRLEAALATVGSKRNSLLTAILTNSFSVLDQSEKLT